MKLQEFLFSLLLSYTELQIYFVYKCFIMKLNQNKTDNYHPSCPSHTAPPILLRLAPVTEDKKLYSSRQRRIPIKATQIVLFRSPRFSPGIPSFFDAVL